MSHQSNEKKSTKASKQMSMLKKVLLTIGGVGVILTAVVGYMSYTTLNQVYKKKPDQESLNIRQGESYSRFIDQITKEQGVSFPVILKIYQKFWIHDTLKVGVYELKEGMTIKQVLDMISNSDNVQLNRIVVIEGTTFKQLIQNLKKDPLVKNTILDLPQEELLKALGITEQHPEGLFAPDTYFFNKGETDKRILLDLYKRQQTILNEEWKKRDDNLPYKTPYEALIMASIIDKETNVDAELAQVSGVFYRRLNMGMKLQTDPTVIYGMGDKYKGNITRQDLRTPTPYNTYTITGLPPTPISLPSQKAIHAALHPDKTSKAIYFVATGKGGHTFSETLEQHNQAVEEYLQVLRQKKDQ